MDCGRITQLHSIELGVGVFAGPGAFFRTKVLNIFPRFHLFNHTSVPLAVRPHLADGAGGNTTLGNVVVIAPGTTTPFHFPLRGQTHTPSSGDEADGQRSNQPSDEDGHDATISMCVVDEDEGELHDGSLAAHLWFIACARLCMYVSENAWI